MRAGLLRYKCLVHDRFGGTRTVRVNLKPTENEQADVKGLLSGFNSVIEARSGTHWIVAQWLEIGSRRFVVRRVDPIAPGVVRVLGPEVLGETVTLYQGGGDLVTPAWIRENLQYLGEFEQQTVYRTLIELPKFMLEELPRTGDTITNALGKSWTVERLSPEGDDGEIVQVVAYG